MTPDNYLRAVMVAREAESLPPERLETLLGPILVSSREQQKEFGHIFREVLAEERRARKKDSGTNKGEPETTAPPRRLFALALWTTLTFFGLMTTSLKISLGPDPPAGATVAPPLPTPTVSFVETSTTIDKPVREFDWPRITAATFVIVLLMSLLTLTVVPYWPRWDRTPPPPAEPPFQWDLRGPPPPLLFDAVDLARLSRALRGKTEAESASLDIRRTVVELARRPTDPRLVYSSDLRQPEYVVLIEKRSDADHQAAYYDRLVTLLIADGLDIRRFYFEYSPGSVWSTSRQQAMPLADVHRRSPAARLIVFGVPRALHHPRTGEIIDSAARAFRWPRQVIVTPDAPPELLPRTIAAVGGAEWISGLADAFVGDYRPRQRVRQRPVPLHTVESVQEARAALSPAAWRWLLACAAYPNLQWDLTLALGTRVCAAQLPEAIRELVALPWFRDGEIPDHLRESLLSALREDGELESIAREVIISLLEKTVLPAGSYAARERDLHLVAQRIWLQQQRDPSKLTEVVGQVRQFRLSEIGRDAALLRFLLGAPATRVAHRIPPRLRRMWFRFGIPAMGRRSLRGLPISACVTMSLLASVRWGAETFTRDDPNRFERVETTTFIAQTITTTQAVQTDTLATDTVATDTLSTDAFSTDTSGTDTFTTGPFSTADTVVTETSSVAADTASVATDTFPTGVTETSGTSLTPFGGTREDTSQTTTTGGAPVPSPAPSTEPPVSRETLVLLEPANDAVIPTPGNEEVEVTFRWNPPGAYALKIDGEVGFEENLNPEQTSLSRKLRPGSYEWYLQPDGEKPTPPLAFTVAPRTSFDLPVSIFTDCGAGRIPRQGKVELDLAPGERVEKVEIVKIDPVPDPRATGRTSLLGNDTAYVWITATNVCGPNAVKSLKGVIRVTLKRFDSDSLAR